MIWERHHRFECANCECEATLSGRLEQLVCRNPECLYEDTPYDQDAILHVMLDADSLTTYHQEIRRILDERQAPQPKRPYLFKFKLIPGRVAHLRSREGETIQRIRNAILSGGTCRAVQFTRHQ